MITWMARNVRIYLVWAFALITGQLFAFITLFCPTSIHFLPISKHIFSLSIIHGHIHPILLSCPSYLYYD